MAEERLEEIRQTRLSKRQQLIDSGQMPYPAEVRRTHTMAELKRQFEQLVTAAAPIIVVGRIVALRKHGGVAFLDVRDATDAFQLQLAKGAAGSDAWNRLELLDVGDFLQAAGKLVQTRRGTQTLDVRELHLISKSIRALPSTWFGLKDHETRFRQREVDLLLNNSVKDIFILRGNVTAWLRRYLSNLGYLEVDTATLQTIAGGAFAQPFQTHHRALDMPLYLRIALELSLKRLLVGGFEKVFEIGHCFRNEGIDRQHNPEFSLLELQWAYADYEDLMNFTEDLFEQLVRELKNTTDVQWQDLHVSFDKPFKRERYVDLVSACVGFDILQNRDPELYIKFCEKENLTIPEPLTYSRLVDEIYKKLIRPTLVQPTLLYDYPADLAPLAKRNATDPRFVEKFQLVVAGMELINAYTELNDPVEQRRIFKEQQLSRDKGDLEAHHSDEDYLRAMEYGMPPNAGWGLGIDRLVMILANAPTLRDTILFPLLRPDKTNE